jgi:hypothetical protein
MGQAWLGWWLGKALLWLGEIKCGDLQSKFFPAKILFQNTKEKFGGKKITLQMKYSS